jgi:intracellular septation protein A
MDNKIKSIIINKEFIGSVIIPIIIFSVFKNFHSILTGTILAGIWTICVVLIGFIRENKIYVYALIASIFSAIGLIGTILSKDPTFYLASPIVSDILFALICFGSLILRKPLIQTFAEYQMKNSFPESLQKNPRYKLAWIILTVAWGVLNLSQALLRFALLFSVSKELYYSINTIYGSISTPLLLIFSFWFPGWYWRRHNLIIKNKNIEVS